MIIEAFIPSQYFVVQKWWEKHEFPPVDYRVLPPYGLIVPNVCAAWLYLSDAPLSFFAWPVSNPDAKARDIASGFDAIISEMKEHSKKCGKLIMVSYVASPSLALMLQKNNFKPADIGVNQFVYRTE